MKAGRHSVLRQWEAWVQGARVRLLWLLSTLRCRSVQRARWDTESGSLGSRLVDL